MADSRLDLATVLLGSSMQDQFGLVPFDRTKHVPRDIGLGGPSTEYLATEYDPFGQVMNYPTIWWDQQGNPHLLDPSQAYDMALTYEQMTSRLFPRFPSIEAAEFSAMNRSAQGGAEVSPLASLLGYFK